MLFTLAVLLSLASSSVLAKGFTLPNNQPDGLYAVHQEGDVFIHQLVNDASTATFTTPINAVNNNSQQAETTKHKRASAIGRRWGASCNDDFNIPHPELDDAYTELDRACGDGSWVEAKHDWYARRGAVVVYFCNRNAAGQYCYGKEVRLAGDRINNLCGAYNGGWTDYGYGREYAPDRVFCGSTHA